MSMPTPRPLQTPIDATRPGLERRPSSAPSVAAVDAPRFRAAVASATGTRHDVNEDAHSALDATLPLFVVADGVGGGALAGDASRGLVSHLHAALDGGTATAERVRAALLDADRAIARSIADRTDARGAATVALCLAADATLARWLVAWVGDCRAYRLQGAGPAELLTTDDTYQNLGESTPTGGLADDPARMVGNGAVDAPNVREIELSRGDLLLLCSDGVHKYVLPADLAAVHGAAIPLARRCTKLVLTARSNGSHDDATVLVVEPRAGSARPLRGAALAGGLAALAAVVLWLAADGEGTHVPVTSVSAVARQGIQP